jgi:hypothetical protein
LGVQLVSEKPPFRVPVVEGRTKFAPKICDDFGDKWLAEDIIEVGGRFGPADRGADLVTEGEGASLIDRRVVEAVRCSLIPADLTLANRPSPAIRTATTRKCILDRYRDGGVEGEIVEPFVTIWSEKARCDGFTSGDEPRTYERVGPAPELNANPAEVDIGPVEVDAGPAEVD